MSFTQKNLVEALRVYAGRKPRNRLFGLFVEEAAKNYATFDRLHDTLADQASRDVLSWALRFRMVAYLAQSRDVASELVPAKISGVDWAKMLEQTKTLPEAAYEKNLDIDLIENFILDGYNLPGICSVEAEDTVLDFGGFNGNSAIALGRHCSKGQVHVFEPNPAMHDALTNNINKSGLTNIRIVKAGVGKEATTLRFKKDGAASRIDPKGNIEVNIINIDEWVSAQNLDRVDFLKFDIEGFEVPALEGAVKTIRHYRPKMAISIYHLYNDFTTIPQLVEDIGGWYNFYLRHNAISGGEIVLFCQPK